MTATATHSRLYALGRLVLLVAAIALTVWGISLVAFSNSMRDTRVGIPIAFWGVLFGYAAIRMGNSRRPDVAFAEDGTSDAAGEVELRASSELVRERDEAARREYEIRLELMLRRELEVGMREELAALRRDVAELRGDVLDAVDGRLRMERVEITRIIGSNLAALHDDGVISLNPAVADLTVPAPAPDDQPTPARGAEAGRDPASLASWTAMTTSTKAATTEPPAQWVSRSGLDSSARPSESPATPSWVSLRVPPRVGASPTREPDASADPSVEPTPASPLEPARASSLEPASDPPVDPTVESSSEPGDEPDRYPGRTAAIEADTVTPAHVEPVETEVAPGEELSPPVTVGSDSGELTMVGETKPSAEFGGSGGSATLGTGTAETPPAGRPARDADPFANLPRLSSFQLPDLPEGVSVGPLPVPPGPADAEPALAEPAATRPAGGYVGRRRHAADDDSQTGEAASVGRHGAAAGDRSASLASRQTSGKVPASRHRG